MEGNSGKDGVGWWREGITVKGGGKCVYRRTRRDKFCRTGILLAWRRLGSVLGLITEIGARIPPTRVKGGRVCVRTSGCGRYWKR